MNKNKSRATIKIKYNKKKFVFFANVIEIETEIKQLKTKNMNWEEVMNALSTDAAESNNSNQPQSKREINERVFIDLLKIFEEDPSVKKIVKRLLINEFYGFLLWKNITLQHWRCFIDRIAKEWAKENLPTWKLAKQTINYIWKRFVKQIPVYSSSEIPGLKIPGVEVCTYQYLEEKGVIRFQREERKGREYVFARIHIHMYNTLLTKKKIFSDEQNKALKRTFEIPF
ncbi:hypothetical protein RFI_20133, partial [Reticulomyxa filosa]